MPRPRDPRLNAVASLKHDVQPLEVQALKVVIHGLMPWPH